MAKIVLNRGRTVPGVTRRILAMSPMSVIYSIAAVVAAQALDAVFLIPRDLASEREPAIEQEMRDRHDKRPRPNIRVESEVT